MVGSASYEFALPYDGELKKGLTVIGLEYSYGDFYPSVAIYNGNKWVSSNGNIGISSIQLKNSILSLSSCPYLFLIILTSSKEKPKSNKYSIIHYLHFYVKDELS